MGRCPENAARCRGLAPACSHKETFRGASVCHATARAATVRCRGLAPACSKGKAESSTSGLWRDCKWFSPHPVRSTCVLIMERFGPCSRLWAGFEGHTF